MSVEKLTERRPTIGADELITTLVPPPRFDDVRLSTYIPNPDEPSQAAAVAECGAFAERVAAGRGKRSGLRGLFGRKDGGQADGKPGLYLDGGFGVGKTHLLASIWHAVPGPKSYGTFVELTHVVGALGFAEAVRRLSGHRLLAIDEFELDDPGDTMLVNRLLKELTEAGVFVAATSNTLPDEFDALCDHLAGIHPSAYGRLVDGVSAVHLRGVRPAEDQAIALRLVAFADRLYDRAIPVLVSGGSLDALFTPEMLAGGYRKKYLRAVSRLTALARDAEETALR
ncbi:ATPase [Streptomyces regensis]|nr:ATPase [Streptomyces regensis]